MYNPASVIHTTGVILTGQKLFLAILSRSQWILVSMASTLLAVWSMGNSSNFRLLMNDGVICCTILSASNGVMAFASNGVMVSASNGVMASASIGVMVSASIGEMVSASTDVMVFASNGAMASASNGAVASASIGVMVSASTACVT